MVEYGIQGYCRWEMNMIPFIQWAGMSFVADYLSVYFLSKKSGLGPIRKSVQLMHLRLVFDMMGYTGLRNAGGNLEFKDLRYAYIFLFAVIMTLHRGQGYFIPDIMVATIIGAMTGVFVCPMVPVIGHSCARSSILKLLLHTSVIALAATLLFFPYSIDAPIRVILQHNVHQQKCKARVLNKEEYCKSSSRLDSGSKRAILSNLSTTSLLIDSRSAAQSAVTVAATKNACFRFFAEVIKFCLKRRVFRQENFIGKVNTLCDKPKEILMEERNVQNTKRKNRWRGSSCNCWAEKRKVQGQGDSEGGIEMTGSSWQAIW